MGYRLPCQFSLDKQIPLWLMEYLIIFTGYGYEKEPDKFQQHEEEANPRISGQNVHQGG